MLRILFGVAVKQELIPSNPLARPGLLPTKPQDQIWTPDFEAEFIEAAPQDRLRLGFMLMLYTLQRLSDVLAMTRGQIEERDGRLFIALRQQKTKDRTNELLLVPVHRNLEPLLRARLADKTGGLLLVPSSTGRPWSRQNFSRKWDATMRRLALRQARRYFRLGWSKEQVRAELAKQHRQRRDLRRTGVVRMAEAGRDNATDRSRCRMVDRLCAEDRGHLSAPPERGRTGRLAGVGSRRRIRTKQQQHRVRLSSASPKRGRAKHGPAGAV